MNKKVIIWIVVIAAVAIIGYFAWKAWKNKQTQDLLNSVTPAASPASPSTSTSGGSSTGYSDEFPLHIGSRGTNVLAAQVALNNSGLLYGKTITEDGAYGNLTAGAADVALSAQKGHIAGKITYSEYVFLKKKALETGGSDLSTLGSGGGGVTASILKPCQTAAGREYLKTMHNIDCADYGV